MRTQHTRPSPLFLALLAVTIGGGVLTILESEFAYTTGVVILVLGGWAVSLCLHEFGHAIVAYRGGDREVAWKGYLTLDIRRYTDPLLSIVLPLIFLLIGGIPLPGGAVWINHHALRNKRVESWVSLAGPLSNLALGVLLILSVQLFMPGELTPLSAGLSFLAFLQIFAFLLNILPIPGLDGWGAIQPYLSYKTQVFGHKAAQWAPLILFAALIGLPGVGSAFYEVILSIFEAVGGSGYAAALGRHTFMFWL
ncbi:site-2 protease family protein [Kibdelosporangium phytohabitans]|uniref:Peptidase M50 n=1 Tax=Kibdelosporangium phytohabitans TaxID=860235 RepID=A0A0N9IBB5_9PSEU|nr:site-2 protease family protein [Kibdelosporangium phytohabitans]ALG13606.1 peptidase M50 [Kibdelosporangium phytohabitans]MBE1465479.1 Zn-dependent protease [Kibdelosporangium phytohabitans]